MIEKIENTDQKQIIDKVFGQLTKERVLVSKGKADCASCTVALLEKTEGDKGLSPSGYTWFHQQDIEHLNKFNNLMIGFDGENSDTPKAIKLGKHISELFKSEGCTIDWDGTDAIRIMVIFPKKVN